MPTKSRKRSTTLAASELGQLHERIVKAESALLFTELPDASLEPLRARAVGLNCELLGALAQLRRRLGEPDNEARARAA